MFRSIESFRLTWTLCGFNKQNDVDDVVCCLDPRINPAASQTETESVNVKRTLIAWHVFPTSPERSIKHGRENWLSGALAITE